MNTRSYSGEEDWLRMHRLLVEIYRLAGPPAYCSDGELDWWRCLSLGGDRLNQVQLWLADDDELFAFAWPEGSGLFVLPIHPSHPELVEDVLDWVEVNGPLISPIKDDEPGISVSCSNSDEVLQHALVRRGYLRGGNYYAYRTFEFKEGIPEPLLPAGYIIRSMAGREDLAVRVTTHRAVFDPSRMTEEKYHALTTYPSYDRDLDLVAEASDGSIAGFALLWYDATNLAGTFEPVGTHPAHRQIGISRALLLEGCRRIQKRGALRAHVQCWGGDVGPARLYQSSGFIENDRFYDWKKLLNK